MVHFQIEKFKCNIMIIFQILCLCTSMFLKFRAWNISCWYGIIDIDIIDPIAASPVGVRDLRDTNRQFLHFLVWKKNFEIILSPLAFPSVLFGNAHKYGNGVRTCSGCWLAFYILLWRDHFLEKVTLPIVLVTKRSWDAQYETQIQETILKLVARRLLDRVMNVNVYWSKSNYACWHQNKEREVYHFMTPLFFKDFSCF